jgi:peptide/bleomycin uptake transporter
MLKSFFHSKEWAVWAWGGLAIILASVSIQVYIVFLLNGWYGEFYDILQKAEQHEVQEFWDKLLEFFMLAMPYVIVATITNWFTRVYSFRWRQAITFGYFPRWRNVEHDIEGASQRLQEDTYKFAKIVETLGLQVVRAIMTLIAFIPVLWALSEHVTLDAFTGIPGSLVWVALFVSLGGLVVSWFVGWFLPGLEYNNQKVEAAFRKELVLAETDKANYASEETVLSLFTGLRVNYQRLFNHYGYFDVWQNLYSQVMVIVPYVIMGPSLFAGAIMLGTLVKVSNAFQKVHQSFSLFTENWTLITELRSIWKRLKEFEQNLEKHNE